MNSLTETNIYKAVILPHQDELKIKDLEYSKLLEGVLKAIPDIIGVYEPDHTIMFYNHIGYEVYQKNPSETKGKKCYEMLSRKQKCYNCPADQALKTKQPLKVERFIPEFSKFMECYYNPVCNDNGEVLFIVEQLRDINEKKCLENILRESEERYRQIVNLSPDAIVITVDGEVVLANNEALKYNHNFIGESIYKHAPNFAKVLRRRLKQILRNKTDKMIFDYKITLEDGNEIDMEVSSSYLNYKGKPGVLSIMRDITERRKELYAAAKIQNKLLQKKFPFSAHVKIDTLYIPAKIVSGDFFHIHQVNKDLMLGIISDVSGKGVTAALSVSAFHVLFRETALIYHDPMEILQNLNKKIGVYLEESYIAACCFSLDFKLCEAKIAGAGINEFIFHKNNEKCQQLVVKGPFLGMFEDSVFEEQLIHFKPGDKFYFFSDGLEPIFSNPRIQKNYIDRIQIKELKKYINHFFNHLLQDIDGGRDDCTLLALEIK